MTDEIMYPRFDTNAIPFMVFENREDASTMDITNGSTKALCAGGLILQSAWIRKLVYLM